MSEGICNPSASINDWARDLRPSHLRLAEALDIGRDIRDAELERLDLPRYKKTTVPLPVFLCAPDIYFQAAGSERFFVNLSPTKAGEVRGYARVRNHNLSSDDVMSFIDAHVPVGHTGDFIMSVSEYYDNELSGSIVIDSNGGMLMESAPGDHLSLATGFKTPDYFVVRDKFLRTFKYFRKTKEGLVPLEDTQLRRELYAVLENIPHHGIARDMEFDHPGYYEFTCVRRQPTNPLEPIFLEYQNNPTYQLADNEN